MDGCKLASEQMQNELKSIWRACFNSDETEIDLFYRNMFRPENTIVYMFGGHPVSALYLLDASIMQSNAKLPGYYIYAAGTLREHRRKGYMERLLRFAQELSVARKKQFLTLLPASESLYEFYAKRGFKKFFKVCRVTLELSDMEKLSFGGQKADTLFLSDEIYKLRKNFFCKGGCVQWSQSHVDYALKLNQIYGGKIFFSGESYAVCAKAEDGVEVIEFAVKKADLSAVISQIIDWVRCDRYIFRLPLDSKILEEGEFARVEPFGMIKPLKCEISVEEEPYLGLALE